MNRSHLTVAPAEFQIPAPYCPLPVATHPKLEQLVASHDAWVHRHGLNDSRQTQALLDAAAFCQLAAMAYPRFTLEALIPATQLVSWIIQFDESELEGPANRGDFTRSLSNLLAARRLFEDPHQELNPNSRYLRACQEALQDLQAISTAVQMDRFVGAFIAGPFFGNACELSYLAGGIVPSFEEYLAIRASSAGCAPFSALIDIGRGYRFSEAVWTSREFRTLRQLGNELFGLANDLVAYWRDIRAPRPTNRNAVILLSNERCMPPQQAAHEIWELHRQRTRQLIELCQQLRKSASEQIRDYVTDFEYLISSPTAWYTKISRYTLVEEF